MRFRFWHGRLKAFVKVDSNDVGFNELGELIIHNENITCIQQYTGLLDYYRWPIAEGDILLYGDIQLEVIYMGSGFILKDIDSGAICLLPESSEECIGNSIKIKGHILQK